MDNQPAMIAAASSQRSSQRRVIGRSGAADCRRIAHRPIIHTEHVARLYPQPRSEHRGWLTAPAAPPPTSGFTCRRCSQGL